jgi:hypothetical protein
VIPAIAARCESETSATAPTVAVNVVARLPLQPGVEELEDWKTAATTSEWSFSSSATGARSAHRPLGNGRTSRMSESQAVEDRRNC